jgi:hypothetical protein
MAGDFASDNVLGKAARCDVRHKSSRLANRDLESRQDGFITSDPDDRSDVKRNAPCSYAGPSEALCFKEWFDKLKSLVYATEFSKGISFSMKCESLGRRL